MKRERALPSRWDPTVHSGAGEPDSAYLASHPGPSDERPRGSPLARRAVQERLAMVAKGSTPAGIL